jgi:VCBS repeat protein
MIRSLNQKSTFVLIVVVFALLFSGIGPVYALSAGCKALNALPLNIAPLNKQTFTGTFNKGEFIYAQWASQASMYVATLVITLNSTGRTEYSGDGGLAVRTTGLLYSESYTITLSNGNPTKTLSGNWVCNPTSPKQPVQKGPIPVGPETVGAAAQGESVALSTDGNTAIVGGYGDNSNAGAAWVFTQSGGVWTPQGSKLVGTGAVGAANQGHSVAVSGDGNTAIVGGANDNNATGAVWIFTRSSGGVWTQQGSKLVGTGAVGGSSQGWSVALSSDGNTAIVGALGDNSGIGAAWVFSRSGSVWTQQGSKLVGTGAANPASQGTSVALSGDGNTAIVGGPSDDGTGATWVFTRSGSVWTQQGSKLVGTGAVGSPNQGWSVALSTDGNTAIVGGPYDNAQTGAVWVFTRSGGIWTQQGSKLVGPYANPPSYQGNSVALSTDGNTAIVGGYGDSSYAGAAWVFTRSGGIWTPLGSPLVGSGAVGSAEQGWSVALSGNGSTFILGGPAENSNVGGAWVFVKRNPNATHDFNGDGFSDILWRDAGGDVAMWLMNGSTIIAGAGLGNVPNNWSIVGQHDFNGDSNADILWTDTSGDVAMWLLNGGTVTSSAIVATGVPNYWSIVGTGDFDGDGNTDILWRDTGGDLAIWFMNGSTITSTVGLGNLPNNWTVVGTGDFDGDGKTDILFRDTSGNVAVWLMNGSTITSSAIVANAPSYWTIVGTGDFNGDGMTDILWRDTGGDMAIWFMNGTTLASGAGLGNVPAYWNVVETGDFNGDGKSDILWTDTGGDMAVWFMNGNGTTFTGAGLGNVPPNVWTPQSTNAE